jgi:hypothetical protein
MPPLQENAIQIIVENSVKRFKESLGWKASFIDPEDTENYKKEIRQVIQEARRP